MRVKNKLVAVSLLQLTVVIAAILVAYYFDAKDKIRAQYIQTARAVVMTAESARESMAEHWKDGLITTEVLQGWAEQGKVDRIVSIVPVITAFRTAMAKADESGYEFRVPKFQPRDPANEPDAFEARVLGKIKAENLEEYFEIDETTNAIRYFRPIKLTPERMLCHGDPDTSLELWGNDQGLDPTGTLMEGWNVGETHGAFEVVQSLDEADRQLTTTIWKGIGLVLGLATVGVVFFITFINRSISRPLHGVTAAISRIVRGDATVSLQARSDDEFGELTQAFSQVVEYLREMAAAADRLAQGDLTTEIKPRSDADLLAHSVQSMSTILRDVFDALNQRAQSLGAAAQHLSTISEQAAGGVSQVSSNADTVAAAAEQMSVNMRDVSQSAERSSQNITTVATATEEMTATIAEISSSAESARRVTGTAVDTVGHTVQRVDELGSAAQAIGKVIDVIVEIAEQTKLLALNATIEAASAGDAGKGFAVVASEVKELAKQTSEATEEIRSSIAAIQGSTQTTVSEIGQIKGVINEVNENVISIAAAVEEQAVTTRDIAESSNQAAVGVQNVTENVGQAATVATSIAAEIASVNRSSTEVRQAIDQINQEAHQLSSLGEELKQMVDRFRSDEDANP